MGAIWITACRVFLWTWEALIQLKRKYLNAYKMLGREIALLTLSSILKFVRSYNMSIRAMNKMYYHEHLPNPSFKYLSFPLFYFRHVISPYLHLWIRQYLWCGDLKISWAIKPQIYSVFTFTVQTSTGQLYMNYSRLHVATYKPSNVTFFSSITFIDQMLIKTHAIFGTSIRNFNR